MTNRQKRLDVALIIGLVVSLLTMGITGFAQDCGAVRQDVLRLHVIPNSDSLDDQDLKLAVRDRILQETGELFQDADSKEQAQALSQGALDRIQQAANDEIQSRGYPYQARVELVNMYFETREYENFTMPAGYYDAVRVTIGAGRGHNWWCVLFPPLCVPAAAEDPEKAFTGQEQEVVTQSPQFEPRFKIVEWFQELWSWGQSLFA